MKKKIVVIIVIIVLLILLIPRIYALNDGGTKIYKALIYEITKVHKIKEDSINEFDEGTVIKIFGIEVFNNIEKNEISEINTKSKPNNDIVEKEEEPNNDIIEKKVEIKNMNKIYIKVKDKILDVELEDNSATKELYERLKNGDIVVNTHEYGGFEKVGDLGFSLPKEDKSITTSAGDIVLYQGNQISLFYNSNSWSYTKLGKIQGASSSELKSILGSGDVTITFTLSR